MLSLIKSYSLIGIDGVQIDAEIDVSNGKPMCTVVGLPDAVVKESIERVQSAIKNSGFYYPAKKLTINLAPADIKKEGVFFDLAIALGILSATQQIQNADIKDYIIVGELSLNGRIRGISGLLPLLISARENGFTKFIIPSDNKNEAGYIDGIDAYAVSSLAEAVKFLSKKTIVDKVEFLPWKKEEQTFLEDFSRIKGQGLAKRAMEIAVAGGHNIMMVGPPGSGKTMLARCVPTILPDLTFEEALEITKIHSVAGKLDHKKGVVTTRPFRAPHHTASSVSLVGGGKYAKPGEISLAHNGVLFLDEMPEFQKSILETLRQPLEDGTITVARAALTVEYPANFMLIASMNPCPCGNYGSRDVECSCSPTQIHNYMRKISGPLLDRIDLKIDVDRVKFYELRAESKEESSLEVKKRIDKARTIQLERYAGTNIFNNAKINSRMLKKYCSIDKESEKLLEDAFKKYNMSARGYTRILKVARTIADLDGHENIDKSHIAEAISYRTIDKFDL